MANLIEGDVLDGTNCMGYSLDDCQRVVIEFFICDEMPFKVVEGHGFRRMMNRLKPRFIVPSRLLDFKPEFRLHVFDCTFIDENWRLQKRILNFFLVENHKGETTGREIERCLREMEIEIVFTITVDNATSSNDRTISYIRRKLDTNGGLVCGGKYLHMRWCAHILNLVVNDGLKEQQPSIDSIRNVVRYVRYVFAISVSTIASESCFSTSGRCLTSFASLYLLKWLNLSFSLKIG
ncbi:hypothetical protein Lal_00018874 [Lupinus albus]|nr:hypothetical protein Lal_00018874 [Lupinus albus]